MTSEEIIASFMEKRPENTISRKEWDTAFHDPLPSAGGWWQWSWERDTGDIILRPAPLTLDRLWLVEDMLNFSQGLKYTDVIHHWVPYGHPMWSMLHATPAQKIKALAEVLRPEQKLPLPSSVVK